MKKETEHDDRDDIDIQSCSAMDCTGLIPAPPRSKDERENYEELYPYLPKAYYGSKEQSRQACFNSSSPQS